MRVGLAHNVVVAVEHLAQCPLHKCGEEVVVVVVVVVDKELT